MLTYEQLQLKEEINTPLPKVGHSWRCFARLKILSLHFPTASPSLFCLLIFVPHHPSLWLCKEPAIQIPTRWLLWDISLPSSWSEGFLNKVLFLASTPCLRFIVLLCGKQIKLGLGNIATMYPAWLLTWGQPSNLDGASIWGTDAMGFSVEPFLCPTGKVVFSFSLWSL